MKVGPIDETQRKAARVVGFVYLFAMAAAIFGESYVRGRLVDYGSAENTARNILENELLFRLGVGSELVTFACTVVLLTGLYLILRPIHQGLALLAVGFRLVETAVCVVMTLTSLDVLRLLSEAEYLSAFETDRLQAMVRLQIGAHAAAYNVAFIFLGLGSTVFSYLWLKSNYIPRVFPILGLVASPLLAAGSFSFLLFPSLASILSPAYMAPMGLFEVGMGFWLLLRGLRAAPVAGG